MHKPQKIPSSSLFLILRLKELRRAARLTQEQVAEISGIDYKVYQHIETGRRKNLQLKTLDRLAWTYGIGLSELFAGQLPAIKLSAQPKKKIPGRRGRKKSPQKPK